MTGDSWQPTAAELSGLGTPGRAFVARLLAVNDVAPHEGPLVLTAAHAEDGLLRTRQWQRRARTMREKLAMERLAIKWQTQLARALFELRRASDEAEGEADDYEA